MGKVKPRHRGLSHFIAFFVFLAASVGLVLSPRTGGAYVGGVVYALTVVLMFGLSGSYHRVTWSFRTRRVLRQLDHSGIFFLIAGSYTAFWTLAPPAARSQALLVLMWGCSVFGVVAFVIWTDMHRALRAAVYVVLGLSTIPLAIHLPGMFGWPSTLMVMGGGAIYSLGAVVYARRWPDPDPRVFGYHEVFHVMVILAAALQFVAVVRLHWAGATSG